MDLFYYTFFQNAMIGSLLVSIACGIIGTYIVTRRLVFISGGITHASMGGVGIALYSGFPPLWCTLIFSLLSALGIQWLSGRKNVREDSAIAVFWTLGMALGILFSFLTPGYASDLSTYLFGNILTITLGDLWLLFGVAGALVVFFTLFLRSIVSIAFDANFARSQGLPVAVFEYVLMAFIALTVVATLRIIGIVLAISMLTLPQMTANLFTMDFKRMIWLSVLVAVVSCAGGLFVSYFLNVPSGASVIFFSIIIYVLCKAGQAFFLSLYGVKKS